VPALRIEKRLETRYLDHRADDLDCRARDDPRRLREGAAISVGLLGNAAEVFPELVRRGVVPDIVTDQTSAHDPANGYLPPAGRWPSGKRSGRAIRPPSRRREAQHGRACAGDARLPAHGVGRARLRQQHPADGEGGGAGRRLRLPGLRAGLHPAAVLPRHRAVPLGGSFG
jgi:hypothetical protein